MLHGGHGTFQLFWKSKQGTVKEERSNYRTNRNIFSWGHGVELTAILSLILCNP